MRIYLSGKIGGEVLTDEVRQKFADAEKALAAKGYEVINPTTSGMGKSADMMVAELKRKGFTVSWYSQILLLDLYALSLVDGICLLPDWWDSPGAIVEKAYAEAIGLAVLDGRDLLNW